MTLASWNDSEFASSSFEASSFGTESSTVAGVWADNDAAPGAALTVAAGSLKPSESKYAWVNIRLSSASTIGGTVALASSTTSGALIPALEFRAVRTPTASSACSAAAFAGTPSYIAGNSTTYLPITDVPVAPAASTLAHPGGELRYCFHIRLKSSADNSLQGAVGTATWLFAGTSN
ncbi:hypothetical protein I6E58_00620 [Salinibacterium sp. SWN1162]|nr:hypothetical protein [Salinibacterium sp. SWN1162]